MADDDSSYSWINNSNNKLNLNMYHNIFKYGPPVNTSILGTRTGVENNVGDNLFIKGKNIEDIIENIENYIENNDNTVNVFTEDLNTININITNLGDIITTIDTNITNIGDEITTIINDILNIDNSIANIDNSITNLNNEITNININNIFDEVYNNISNWSITEYGDTYTFSKVSINTVENLNFELTINGSTFIKNSIYISGPEYRIHVKNQHLYFNDCRLDKCGDKDSVAFYLCFDFLNLNLCNFEAEIKAKILLKDSSIDFSFLEFEFTDIVKVMISIRDDICFNDSQKLAISEMLKKILTVISDEINDPLIIVMNGISRVSYPNIYFLNEYYHFEQVHHTNSFKLVKRDDENNNGSLKSGQQVYLKNLNNEYLQTDFTFGGGPCGSCPQKLLLEVHTYSNDFLTFIPSCIVSRKDGFKLEILPPTIVDPNLSIIIGEDYLDNINLCDPNITLTHHGIPDDLLFNGQNLSDLLDQYMLDPSLFFNIFLVDERWLTYNESINQVAIYDSTSNDDYPDSKKFINGSKFCEIIIPDFVFNDTFQLESIEEHGDYMFRNKHLPALSSNYNYDNYINIYNHEQRREDILQELEKAHIYIYKLNDKVKLNTEKIKELEDLISNM